MILRVVSQISRLCHFATGWRTKCIIKLQCLSSEFFVFPTVSCPSRFLADLVMYVLYTQTKILHSFRGHSSRGNTRISLKTVTGHWDTVDVFWCLNLYWLCWTQILTYMASKIQRKQNQYYARYAYMSHILYYHEAQIIYQHLSPYHWGLFWFLALQLQASETLEETSKTEAPLLQDPVWAKYYSSVYSGLGLQLKWHKHKGIWNYTKFW